MSAVLVVALEAGRTLEPVLALPGKEILEPIVRPIIKAAPVVAEKTQPVHWAPLVLELAVAVAAESPLLV